MSGLYEALRKLESEKRGTAEITIDSAQPAEVLRNITGTNVEVSETESAKIDAPPSSRLVALSDPKSLGAEKFRALATRLERLQGQRELKSIQITSSVVNEGKTLVAANLAVTLAACTKSRVLLIEGDLHRPTLTSVLGLNRLKGIGDWWASKDEITRFLVQLNGLQLWFLGAGKSEDQPYQILQSDRFAEAFRSLTGQYEWIVADSTPMLPVVDVNLWSRLVDGTLLVVREGVAPLHALRKGLESLDNPKLIGTVLNEASEFDRVSYTYPY
jgi:capsular exopolysaccharide synthesis family protein